MQFSTTGSKVIQVKSSAVFFDVPLLIRDFLEVGPLGIMGSVLAFASSKEVTIC